MSRRVVVHVGPPKTGTSAIQNWCIKNRDKLLESGVFYPKHQLDPNGVSSGNLHNICDIVEPSTKKNPQKISVSKIKVDNLLHRFCLTQAHTLFISSEYFFQHLDAIKQLIPNVEFLAYLRNPIEILESNYNQGVKRNGFTHTLDPKTFDCFPHVSHLIKFKEARADSNLVVRYFDPNLNCSNSLIDDVLNFLNVNIRLSSRDGFLNINSSYQFEALELKRWLNLFDLKEFQNEIDYILQSYSKGLAKFSLLPPKKYKEIAINYSAMVKSICLSLDISNGELFSESIVNNQQSEFKEQTLTKEQFKSVLNHLKANMNKRYVLLFEKVLDVGKQQNDFYFEWFLTSKPNIVEQVADNIKLRFKWLFVKKSRLVRRVKLRFSNEELVGVRNFCSALDVPDCFEEADVLRELGFLAENNDNIELAICLLEKAAKLRPNGMIISQRLDALRAAKIVDSDNSAVK